jgi:surface protein
MKDEYINEYTCTECDQIPKIINISLETGLIKFKCITHGEKEINVKDYLEKEKKQISYKYQCCLVKNRKNASFNKCLECKRIFCSDCSKTHNHKFLVDVKELNFKCLEHIKFFSKYCKICKKHLCESQQCKCKCSNPKNIIKIGNDVNKSNMLSENIGKLKKKMEYEEYFTQLFDIIIKSNKNHPNNNYHLSTNVDTISEIVQMDEKEEVLEKLNTLRKKVAGISTLYFGIDLRPDSEEINLNDKNIQDKGLSLLSCNDIKLLKRLFLKNNSITNINLLEGLDTKNLIILDLSNNLIKNADYLGKEDFKNIEKLNLSHNELEDISFFKEFKSPNLSDLDLSFNKINNIEPLKAYIPKNQVIIKVVNLDHNNIIQKEIDDTYRKISGEFFECKLVYKLGKNKKIRIVGKNFYNNNKLYCRILIEGGKQSELIDIYENKNFNKELINISLFVGGNIREVKGIFYDCENLVEIKTIFKLGPNISNLEDFFHGCKSLKEITNDITKWEISNETNLDGMFYKCTSLEKIPDISKWKTSNVESMSALFNGCTLLKQLPDISSWDVSKVSSMRCMFKDCKNLEQVPEGIAKWKTSELTDIESMFEGCKELKFIPKLTSWDRTKIKNADNFIKGCNFLDNSQIFEN